MTATVSIDTPTVGDLVAVPVDKAGPRPVLAELSGWRRIVTDHATDGTLIGRVVAVEDITTSELGAFQRLEVLMWGLDVSGHFAERHPFLCRIDDATIVPDPNQQENTDA